MVGRTCVGVCDAVRGVHAQVEVVPKHSPEFLLPAEVGELAYLPKQTPVGLVGQQQREDTSRPELRVAPDQVLVARFVTFGLPLRMQHRLTRTQLGRL